MHVFPQLRKLEQKYEEELAVVGVHSAKFVAEKDTANLRKAVLRYEIEHPVVNDADFAIWGEYTVRAWPTLMFIDPEGKVIGKHEGEITFDVFDRIIGRWCRSSTRPRAHRQEAPALASGARQGVGAAALLPRQGAGRR